MTWSRTAIGLTLDTLLALGVARADSGTDPGELERTWEAAPVYMPGPDGPRRLRTSELAAALASQRGAPVVVVYAHGCAGLDEAAASAGQFLAGAGYLV